MNDRPTENPVAPGPAPDARVAALLGTAADVRVELIGFPTDEGVRRNGGRIGAAGGPAALRRILGTMTPDPRRPDHIELLRQVIDAGDAGGFGSLEHRQRLLGRRIAEVLEAGRIPVVLGGGHETTFGHFLGYDAAARTVSVLNIDAHPDVRPTRGGLGHSGSPFRQAAEHPGGRLASYAVYGLQPHSVSADHLAYLEDRGATAVFRSDIDRASLVAAVSELRSPTLVTIDLDAVDQSQAPGVSAPTSDGLASGEVLAAAEAAGQNPAVTSLDVVELNPRYDVDGRTARLAAKIVWCFLRGLLDRPAAAE